MRILLESITWKSTTRKPGSCCCITVIKKRKLSKFSLLTMSGKKARQKRKSRFGDSIQTSQQSKGVGGFKSNAYSDDCYTFLRQQVLDSEVGDDDEENEDAIPI
ncbi:hypothetical protein Droror1_Dr00021950 [Drosera rotundifolia]